MCVCVCVRVCVCGCGCVCVWGGVCMCVGVCVCACLPACLPACEFVFCVLPHNSLFSSFQTPGPGTYKIVQPAVTKQRMPSYSINGRHRLPTDTVNSPGPGAYSPEKVPHVCLHTHSSTVQCTHTHTYIRTCNMHTCTHTYVHTYTHVHAHSLFTVQCANSSSLTAHRL